MAYFTQLPFSFTPQCYLGGSSGDEASSATDRDEILRGIDLSLPLEEEGFHSDEEVRRIAALFSLFMPPQTAV